MRRRLYVAIVTSILSTLTLLKVLESEDFSKSPTTSKRKSHIVVHVDFKGAPPRIQYLETLFPLLAAAGATTLLVEYEDMFPFEGALRNLSARNAYSKQEIDRLLSSAKHHRLEVIPLVQTFGHLEFALKLPEFKHLRELPSFPQEVCPSNPDSLQNLIFQIIEQVMNLHPDARFLHIGCDEVFHLGSCAKCSARDPRALFAEHVTAVAKFVRSTFSGVTPIIWDDMLRRWSPADHEKWSLGSLVEPMVWVYVEDIHSLLPHFAWYAYRKFFPHVWVAAAYKGASGESEIVPHAMRHHLNTAAWMKIIENCTECRGLVLTGWSRYDHFAVLCELLPVSVPSLVHNLLLANHGNTQKIAKLLKCPQAYVGNLESDPYLLQLADCYYPGSDMLHAITKFINLQMRLDLLHTSTNGWLEQYNIRRNFSSPMRVLQVHGTVTELARLLAEYKNSTMLILLQYVDHFGAEEWLEQKVSPLQEEVTRLDKVIQDLLSIDTWPRRPL